MSLRSIVVDKALWNDEVDRIIGHGITSYIPFLGMHVSILIVLFIISWYAVSFIDTGIVRLMFTVISLIVYSIALISFLDTYLDVLVLSKHGLHIFKRDGLFQNNIQTIERSSIQSVLDSQNGILDTLTNAWDLSIIFQYGEVDFNDIHHPWEVRLAITHLRDKHTAIEEKEKGLSEQKFNALVNTLGEVILEHYDKIHTNSNEESQDDTYR